MATKQKIIHGVAFTLNQPYEAGQVLNEAEARALNQVRSENIGNNIRERIKEFLEKNDEQGARDLVAQKDAEYVLTIREVGEGASRSLDPVEKEARAIARELVKNHLAATGRKLNVAPEGLTIEEWKDKVSAQIETISESPDVLKAAKKNVDDKKKRLESLAGVEI